ncbi:MAG: hypothetical protein C4533_05305 [Candidatus Omnitrophota bacterium]|jgi:TolA-binding protein|nr:MAG: hypothetical protein C4533_05305 [Candidatus Omnitrophota bacterium]
MKKARLLEGYNFGSSKFIFSAALVLIFLFITLYGTEAFAFDKSKADKLGKQIISSKNDADLNKAFAEIRDLYLNDYKFSEFVEYLKSLSKKKKTLEPFINYYIAYTRFYQLKYLEENQNWDEYFANGNDYRDELTSYAQKAADSTTAKDEVGVDSRLLLWVFHKGQQDAFSEKALEDLIGAMDKYSQDGGNATVIKTVADWLGSYGEKAKARKLYGIYLNKIISANVSLADLLQISRQFYDENNVELSKSAYDIYIERASKELPADKFIPEFINIAKMFSYNDSGINDPLYAEKVFSKIEDTGVKSVFDQELIYLRAFNLEKAKELKGAGARYDELLKQFPDSEHAQEADYKVGIIQAYVLRDIAQARVYFEKLAKGIDKPSSWVISSLYQLGLLSQWEGDITAAKDYYNKLIGSAGQGYNDTAQLAKLRLAEIQESRPMEYNLKTFMDLSLKPENSAYDMNKIALKSRPYLGKPQEEVQVASEAFMPESGCMQVDLQYLWSGHTGSAKPAAQDQAFNTKFTSDGTKEINLVVVSPQGVVDRNIDLVDVR